FSPDGKRIVTASRDNTARVWDAQTGQPLTEPLKHRHFVTSAQFSPDGSLIATASWDGTARVWDALTGEPLSEPLPHGVSVTSVQFSPDGRRILTASDGMTAHLWDVGAVGSQCPDWLLELSEAISGQVLNMHGVLEETRRSRGETLDHVRET